MTAPGDIVLIVILLSVFLACAGYAAGRLHQRWHTEPDREEAYRDGYETATQNVFSSAARMLTSRRSVRASAAVKPNDGAAARAKPDSLPQKPAATPPTASPVDGAGSPVSTTAVGAPVSTTATGAASTPVASSFSAPPADASPPFSTPTSGMTTPPPSPFSVPSHLTPAAEQFASTESADAPTPPASTTMPSPTMGDEALGFPAPLPPPTYAVAEPSAIGGLTYRPFPDPRVVDGSGLLLGEGPTYRPPLPRPRLADRSGLALGAAGRPTPADQSAAEVGLQPGTGSQPGGVDQPGEQIRTGAELHPGAAVQPGVDVAFEAGAEGRVGAEGRPGVGGRSEFGGRQNLRPRAAEATGQPGGVGLGQPVGARLGLEPGVEEPVTVGRPAGHRAAEDDTMDPAVAVGPEVSSGRHTVPDELVQATTYRLPADRVFRARVPDGTRLPDEPTTRLGVPKPRES